MIIASAVSKNERGGILAFRHIRDAGIFSQLIEFPEGETSALFYFKVIFVLFKKKHVFHLKLW